MHSKGNNFKDELAHTFEDELSEGKVAKLFTSYKYTQRQIKDFIKNSSLSVSKAFGLDASAKSTVAPSAMKMIFANQSRNLCPEPQGEREWVE